jgi:hypothetical protein
MLLIGMPYRAAEYLEKAQTFEGLAEQAASPDLYRAYDGLARGYRILAAAAMRHKARVQDQAMERPPVPTRPTGPRRVA